MSGKPSPTGGPVENRDTSSSGDLPSLAPLPPLCTLPPLGVLVGVLGRGAIHPSPETDIPKSDTEKPFGEWGSGEQPGEHPKEPPGVYLRGTVFLVHGYLDHSGSWAPVIKRILREGYLVIALDLPGHGISGGERGDIGDFSLYGEAVRRVVDWAVKVSPPRPWIAIGHSTGASAIWIALVRTLIEDGGGPLQAGGGTVAERGNVGETVFDNVLFLAPLVRSAHWRLSMTLVSLTRWAIPYWRSRAAIDPLFPIPYFPVHWAEKLKNWESKVDEYPSISQKGWILQGTSDEVVDHSYSIPFLRSKLPGFRVRYIEGAGHVPYLRTPSGERYVQEVLEALSEFPEESP